jgi:hypothetical protein
MLCGMIGASATAHETRHKAKAEIDPTESGSDQLSMQSYRSSDNVLNAAEKKHDTE